MVRTIQVVHEISTDSVHYQRCNHTVRAAEWTGDLVAIQVVGCASCSHARASVVIKQYNLVRQRAVALCG